MKTLFLFFTQGEAGAPEYLSRTGEQGAEAFAETISTFIQESLKIQIGNSYTERVHSLNEDVIRRSFKEQREFKNALTASMQLLSDVVIVCGNEIRTLKTTEVLAKVLALPICVDNRIDKWKDTKPYQGNLSNALNDLISYFNTELCPKIVLVGTSSQGLIEWIGTQKNPEEVQQFEHILSVTSENDTIPAVFIAGMNKENEKINWVMDLPKLIN